LPTGFAADLAMDIDLNRPAARVIRVRIAASGVVIRK
jgi:hypothetical protein